MKRRFTFWVLLLLVAGLGGKPGQAGQPPAEDLIDMRQACMEDWADFQPHTLVVEIGSPELCSVLSTNQREECRAYIIGCKMQVGQGLIEIKVRLVCGQPPLLSPPILGNDSIYEDFYLWGQIDPTLKNREKPHCTEAHYRPIERGSEKASPFEPPFVRSFVYLNEVEQELKNGLRRFQMISIWHTTRQHTLKGDSFLKSEALAENN